MNAVEVVILAISLAFIMVFGLAVAPDRWFILHVQPTKKSSRALWCCPSSDEVEFSGGYRDAARQQRACSYRLRCSGTLKGRASSFGLMCPRHGARLVER